MVYLCTSLWSSNSFVLKNIRNKHIELGIKGKIKSIVDTKISNKFDVDLSGSKSV